MFDVWDDFYVKNADTSEGLTWGVIGFLDAWHMPLLFVLAGAASWFAFGHRTARGYVAERRARLLVPFLFGLLVVVPPQTYLAQWSKGIEPVQGFFTFGGDLTGYTGGFTPAHLWFIGFLFLFSLGAAPLFARLRRRPIGARWLLVAMPVILALTNGLPAPDDGPQNPFYSLALFIGGFLLVADRRAERLIHRAWRPLFATAVVTMTVVFRSHARASRRPGRTARRSRPPSRSSSRSTRGCGCSRCSAWVTTSSAARTGCCATRTRPPTCSTWSTRR